MFQYQRLLFKRTKTSLTTMDSRKIIQNDEFLRYVYLSHLQKLSKAVENNLEATTPPKIIEIGAAGGITKEYTPEIVTLDVREDQGVDLIISEERLPFEDSSITGAIGKDVFHHIPNVEKHLNELNRVLIKGGKCAYLEPNWNWFSRIFYTLIHPEPWNPKQVSWQFHSEDPMFSNQALPWIVFVRDCKLFEEKFSNLQVRVVEIPMVGLSYLISGGLNRRNRISSKLLIKLYKAEQKAPAYLRVFGLGRMIIITKSDNY